MKILATKKFRKIPILISYWNDGEVRGYRAEIADNYENYLPTEYQKVNFEDLSFHFTHSVEPHPFDKNVFVNKKDAVECAKFVNEKFLVGKAKIWHV